MASVATHGDAPPLTQVTGGAWGRAALARFPRTGACTRVRKRSGAVGQDPVRPLSRPRPGPASAERQTRTPNMNGPPMVFIDS
ncbi:hypothetical protein SHIRM173S_04599 [Streptomyces hirsutus]